MKFFCVCLSPAIDVLVRLPFAPHGKDEIFKDVVEVENVGGKALNVARVLAYRGEKVACGGLLGVENEAPFVRELAKFGIEDHFIRVPGRTRRNEMFTWPGGAFKVNRSAFEGVAPITPEQVLAPAATANVVILSGALPKCCAPTFYGEAIRLLKSWGKKVVLDASGEALVKGWEAGPDLVKPNAEECAAIVGFVPHTTDEFERATAILQTRSKQVIISDGARGAWFDGVFEAALPVEVVDTTAAGDTLLAEWCHSHDAHKAVAAGSAACTRPGSQLGTSF